MNYRVIVRVLGFILAAVGAAMVPSAILSWFDHTIDRFAFLVSALIPLLAGGVTLALTRGERVDLRIREGFAITTFAWLAAAIFGALPYVICGVCGPVDAFFETMSGFTTTGATIFDNIESLPHGILLWRSLTQWLGGMGIVVLSVAILPMLGVGGMQLFRAEVPGPTADRLSPRIQDTAKILWSVYVGLTAIQTVLLMFGGMNLFEAVCHAFTTLSTGGFSTRDKSVGAFDSTYIDLVITAFMFIAGANFSLHFWLVRGRWKRYWKNEEFRYYTYLTIAGSILLTIAAVVHGDASIGKGIRLGLFQMVSIVTSTGYGTADYLLWGFGAHALIFTIMFCGGCAGSTAGGVKVMRVVLLAKHANRVVKKTLHPHAVFNVRHSGKVVDDEVMMTVLGFFLLYFVLFLISSLLVAHLGADFSTAVGATVSALGNVGPGLGVVGPASTYSTLPAASKLILAVAMLFGRLELFTVFVMLTPMFWRKVG